MSSRLNDVSASMQISDVIIVDVLDTIYQQNILLFFLIFDPSLLIFQQKIRLFAQGVWKLDETFL